MLTRQSIAVNRLLTDTNHQYSGIFYASIDWLTIFKESLYLVIAAPIFYLQRQFDISLQGA